MYKYLYIHIYLYICIYLCAILKPIHNLSPTKIHISDNRLGAQLFLAKETYHKNQVLSMQLENKFQT